MLALARCAVAYHTLGKWTTTHTSLHTHLTKMHHIVSSFSVRVRTPTPYEIRSSLVLPHAYSSFICTYPKKEMTDTRARIKAHAEAGGLASPEVGSTTNAATLVQR